MDGGERRRRRVRGTRRAAAPPPTIAAPAPRPSLFSASTAEGLDETASGEQPTDHPGSAHDREDRDERSLRGLIGGGSSQVSVSAALRTRDASRPTDADLADAEAALTIVHRGWVPRDG